MSEQFKCEPPGQQNYFVGGWNGTMKHAFTRLF